MALCVLRVLLLLRIFCLMRREAEEIGVPVIVTLLVTQMGHIV
jgi:hypothetical protein